MNLQLRMLTLYPEQMNIYADRGNILFLKRRCEWRGISFQAAVAGPGEAIDPAAHDLIYIGGGQDRDQRLVAADMLETKREGLAAAASDGAVILAVCGGYQLLGHSYQLGSERIAGLVATAPRRSRTLRSSRPTTPSPRSRRSTWATARRTKATPSWPA